jgi:hypothetical protein
MRYNLLERDRINYISLVLLNEIIQFQHYFPKELTGNDIFLSRNLEILEQNGCLRIERGEYVPTDKGREELERLYNKYYEYLKLFDVFCAVDLEKGEFAFKRINDSMSDDEWYDYLAQERFSDVRVAVADFKGINPMEIVFISFLNENRFDCGLDGWQKALTDMVIWDEIVEVCNTAVDVDYLKQDGVLEDVIKQGTELALELIRLAEEPNEEIFEETEEVIEEYVEVVRMPVYEYDYWDPYYDPYYVSPLWLVPAAIILF